MNKETLSHSVSIISRTMDESAFNNTQFNNATGISSLSGIEQFQFYFTPVIVYLGSIGNGLSVFVFFSTKLKKLSSSYYLAALSISDNIFLACMFVVWLRFVEIDLFNKWGWCQLIVYLTSVCSFLSVWLVLAFTVERFIAVRYPLLRQSLCTVSRAKMFILILVFLAMAFSSPSAIFVTLKTEKERMYCTADPDYQNFLNIFNYIDAFVTFLVPVFAITVLNICISRTVWKLASVRRRLTNRGMPSGFHLRKTTTTTVLRTNRQKKSSTSQNKMTKMLLVVSTVCLCMNLPSYVMRVLADLIKVSEKIYKCA